MFCTNCGSELTSGTKFCVVCGNEVDVLEQSEANAQGASKQAASKIEGVPVKVEVVARKAPKQKGTVVLEALSGDAPEGVPDPPTVILARRANRTIYRIASFPSTIGNDPAADIVIEGSPFISRIHARLAAEGAEVVLEDAGSTNGTTLNGVKLSKGDRPPIAPDDVIAFASEEFVVLFE